jgi:hypothetical protein
MGHLSRKRNPSKSQTLVLELIDSRRVVVAIFCSSEAGWPDRLTVKGERENKINRVKISCVYCGARTRSSVENQLPHIRATPTFFSQSNQADVLNKL